MRVLLGAVLLSQVAVSMPAAGQSPSSKRGGALRVALTVGTSTFNGATAAADQSGVDQVFRPYRPTMVGFGVTYGRERARLGLFARYGRPGLGFRGVDDGGAAGLLIVAESAFNLASFTAAASTRIAEFRGGPVLRSSLGITYERWTAPDTPSRTLVGPQAGLSLEFGLTGALIATVDGEIGFTPGSPFRVEDLAEGFRLRSTWRRTLQAGLSLRL